MLETVELPTPTAPARAYAMRAREDQDAPGVITGNFALYNTEIHALIDPGSTHSYICIEQLSDKLPSVDPLAYDSCHNRVCRNQQNLYLNSSYCRSLATAV